MVPPSRAVRPPSPRAGTTQARDGRGDSRAIADSRRRHSGGPPPGRSGSGTALPLQTRPSCERSSEASAWWELRRLGSWLGPSRARRPGPVILTPGALACGLIIVRFQGANDPGWRTNHDGIGRDVLGDNGLAPDDAAAAQSDAG